MTGRRRGANKGLIGGREQGARVAPKEGSVEGKSAINVRDLVKMFRLGGETITAVDGASFEVQSGETVSIVGPSGSGKSTLLGLLGGLDSPTAGRIAIDGVEIGGMNEGDLTRIRNEKLGFVFQFFNLIPTLTAVENVALPIQFARKRKFNPEERARELLGQLGLGERMEHLPQQLGRWPTALLSSWRMSPLAISTARPASLSSITSSRRIRNMAPPSSSSHTIWT
jgi:ABC-type glutathione transport system ATPase component